MRPIFQALDGLNLFPEGDHQETTTLVYVRGPLRGCPLRNQKTETIAFLRQVLPGKYTFILPASREVPKIVQSKRRHVGIRIPDSSAALALIRELGHPLITTTAARQVEDEISYSNDPDEIAKVFGRSIDVFLDAGALYEGPSTVIDLTGDAPVVLREGSGSTDWIH